MIFHQQCERTNTFRWLATTKTLVCFMQTTMVGSALTHLSQYGENRAFPVCVPVQSRVLDVIPV